jgi:hypothetical protein
VTVNTIMHTAEQTLTSLHKIATASLYQEEDMQISDTVVISHAVGGASVRNYGLYHMMQGTQHVNVTLYCNL